MSSPQTTSPQQACEAILIEGKRYNIEHGILPSENAVADRLLARGVELPDTVPTRTLVVYCFSGTLGVGRDRLHPFMGGGL